jgi:imidazolonepropionase-like amidohydrolase
MSSVSFLGGTLIDGTGSSPLPESAVVVEGGRISWIGRRQELSMSPDAPIVDLSGKYLMPGLMDANVHLLIDTNPEILLRYDHGQYDDLLIEAAQVALRAGITTVFDTWGPLESLRRVRDRIDSGEIVGSRIFFAGNIIGNAGPWSPDFYSYSNALRQETIDAVNGHWEHGVGSDLTWMTSKDVRTAVRRYISTSGIDFVKYAGSSHAHYRFIALSPYSQQAIVEEAHRAGMTAQACTLAPEALRVAIDAGVDLLQHGNSTGPYPMPRETVDLIAARQLPCVLLLYTERRLAALRADTQLPSHWRENMLVKGGNARALIQAGAKLMLATDGGLFPSTADTDPWLGPFLSLPDSSSYLGRSHMLWLKAAIEHGMTPMDALLATTRNIAEAYKRDADIGTVEVGKRADLLVLDGDPLDDVENYARVALVVKDGEIIEHTRLPERPILTTVDR